jgi:hypothetical protein
MAEHARKLIAGNPALSSVITVSFVKILWFLQVGSQSLSESCTVVGNPWQSWGCWTSRKSWCVDFRTFG